MFFLLLISCGFNEIIKISSYYYVVAVDSKDDKDICYKLEDGNYLGLIGGNLSNLFQYKKQLIAVKALSQEDEKSFEYYYIEMYNFSTLYPERGVQGPFTKFELENFLRKYNNTFENFHPLKID